MRILLAHNSTYYPSTGGGDKSNRLLMEALAGRGQTIRVVTRVERFGDEDHAKLLSALGARGVAPAELPDSLRYNLGGVEVRALTRHPNWRAFFQSQIDDFDPDVIVTSTDDPGQILLDLALKAPRARVVYLVRATIAVPFGPDSSMVSAAKTDLLRGVDGVVGVSHYVAGYVRQWSGIDAIHVPISLLEPGAGYPLLADPASPYVSMVNPCAVKGIAIFLGVADRMPHVRFAAIPSWGTLPEELDELKKRPNIDILPPADSIDSLLAQTRVMVVPSVWAEARSRVVVEAMSRGVPVVASDVGGLHEAKLGVPYLVRVNPIVRYKPAVDAGMVPVAEVPPQDVTPWVGVIRKLLEDDNLWAEVSAQSRRAAVEYASSISAAPFEAYLEQLARSPKKEPGAPARGTLSEEKRRLLTLRLKQRAQSAAPSVNPWFPGIEQARHGDLRLFCFPWAGGGALGYRSWRDALAGMAAVCPIRLPGRESRAGEPPIERMPELIEVLAGELQPFLDSPFSFFGHSMGAGIAFELTRELRRRGAPLPLHLHVSGARAPQFRLNHQPGPEPSMRDFIEELRRLEGFPPSILANPELMRLALPSLLADARLYRNYSYQPEPPLPVPIFAYGGDADPNVTAEHMEAWRCQTTSAFLRHEFEGGHFYLESAQGVLLAAVRTALRQA